MFKQILLLIFITVTFLNASSFNNGMKYFKKGNYHKAMPFFMKASKEGNKEAQFYLANMFEKGLGVRKDPKMASKLYKLYSSKSKEKADIQISTIEYEKKNIIKEKSTTKKINLTQKKVSQKNSINKVEEKTKTKIYSKRLKKHYNPEIEAPKEITFN